MILTPYTPGALYVSKNQGLHCATATNTLVEVASYVSASGNDGVLNSLRVNNTTYSIPQASTATAVNTTSATVSYWVGATSTSTGTTSLAHSLNAYLTSTGLYVNASKVMTNSNSAIKAASNTATWPFTTYSNVYIIKHDSGSSMGVCSYSVAMSPQSAAYTEIWGSVTRLNYSGNYFTAIPRITLSSSGVASVAWYSTDTTGRGTVYNASGTTTIMKLIVTN